MFQQIYSPRNSKNFTFTQQLKRNYQPTLNISTSLEELGCVKLTESKYQVYTPKQMTAKFTGSPISLVHRERLKKINKAPDTIYHKTYFKSNTPVNKTFTNIENAIENVIDKEQNNNKNFYKQKANKLQMQNKRLKQQLQVLRNTVFKQSLKTRKK